MAKITPESIADLKALFQDNEKALGSNFSQLIDFFNNNKVTDNGDGTFTAGTITVDVSKLYDLINNSSPNILPLDNEFTGKNTFDIAPINKANGKPYITEDNVPPVDLSNYPTKDQLATKADTSAIDPRVMIKKTLTANDDVLALDPGTYYTWGVKPNNYPALSPWSTVVVKMVGNQPMDGKNVTITDTNASQLVNTYSGNPPTGKWSGWRVPNSTAMASKSDVTTAISAATASLPKSEDSDLKVLTTTTNGYDGSLNYKVKNGVLYMFGAFQIMRSNDKSLSNKVPIFTLPTEIATRLPAMPSSVDIYIDGKTVTRKCLQSSLSNGFDYYITENGEIVSLPPFTVYNMTSNNTSVQNKVFVGDLSFSLPLN